MAKLTWEQKKKIANSYLDAKCGFGWDDLGDINSLHDAETVQDIKDMCDDRINDILN